MLTISRLSTEHRKWTQAIQSQFHQERIMKDKAVSLTKDIYLDDKKFYVNFSITMRKIDANIAKVSELRRSQVNDKDAQLIILQLGKA